MQESTSRRSSQRVMVLQTKKKLEVQESEKYLFYHHWRGRLVSVWSPAFYNCNKSRESERNEGLFNGDDGKIFHQRTSLS